jgi:hypothetical protein
MEMVAKRKAEVEDEVEMTTEDTVRYVICCSIPPFWSRGVKMATGIKYPHARGQETRWARIRVHESTHGHRYGYVSKPDGY